MMICKHCVKPIIRSDGLFSVAYPYRHVAGNFITCYHANMALGITLGKQRRFPNGVATPLQPTDYLKALKKHVSWI